MKVINQSCAMQFEPPVDAIKRLEFAGRIAYQSEGKSGPGTAEPFVRSIIKRGHESVLEHVSFSMLFITDRGVTHELVRHRLASYTQESTRYCDYSNEGKFGEDVLFIRPVWVPHNIVTRLTTEPDEPGTVGIRDCTPAGIIPHIDWYDACLDSERYYKELRKHGWTAQQARTVLNNSLKTAILMTANVREWRHVFSLRTAPAAHPQMRDLMLEALGLVYTSPVSLCFETLPTIEDSLKFWLDRGIDLRDALAEQQQLSD